MEEMILYDFKTKAPLHMDTKGLEATDKLSWLSIMRHHGIPTRLLDFTYSPFVALYFAFRDAPPETKSEPAAVWAIDTRVLLEAASGVCIAANRARAEREARNPSVRPEKQPIDLLSPDLYGTESDMLRQGGEWWRRTISAALEPRGIERNLYKDKGLVLLAPPPAQNLRLSSQQGAFLFNGAEELKFEESLFKMMTASTENWCKRLVIPGALRDELERKLFQMNVHDLSLFPDVEGLAGFLRQKARLHWKVGADGGGILTAS